MKLKELNDAKVEFIVEECFKINEIQLKTNQLKTNDSKHSNPSISNGNDEIKTKEMKTLVSMKKFNVELQFSCESKK
uniref:Uncharacterized protein n=1 Tax=Panagrolaimus sp. PS1159 TaxID=55785 RepID=A0AC35FW96_9BILA